MGDWASPEFGYLADNQWEFTEKVDGTNIRIEINIHDHAADFNFKGRTDNANIPKHLMEYLHQTFIIDLTIRRALQDMRNERGVEALTLYGEGYGPKIQKGGGNYRKDASFVLFDVKIGDFWLDRKNVNDVAEKLGIDAVPVLCRGTLWDAIELVKGFRSQNAETYLKSQWGDFEAEGIVARPTVPLFNRQGNRIITKIKGVDFK
jgi:hypothetical protein